jgi:hypothetical protein
MRKKSKHLFEIPESIVVERLKRYIDECDGDELARLLGDLFGGECSQDVNAEIYNFKPDEFYAGEFNDLKEKK